MIQDNLLIYLLANAGLLLVAATVLTELRPLRAIMKRQDRSVPNQLLLGLLFGLLCAPVCLFTAGLHGAIVWWINGIPFDVIHCAGNFGIALVLFCPLRRLLERLYQGMQARRGGYPPLPP